MAIKDKDGKQVYEETVVTDYTKEELQLELDMISNEIEMLKAQKKELEDKIKLFK